MRMSGIRTWVALLVFAFASFACCPAFASDTASISGSITDPSGGVVAGATVTATNTGTGIANTRITNGQGFYSFQSLALAPTAQRPQIRL